MNKRSRILVTGAAGLAGSAVVEYLRKKGFTSVIPVTHADVDLRDRAATLNLFAIQKPDYVFHAAAVVYGLQGNIDNQYKALFDNTLINASVIDAARIMGVMKIVVMGTNAVYPWPTQLPYREETIFDGRPHEGEAGYGHAKRHMLAMLEASEMDFTYIVSGNLYGPRDKFDPVNGHVLPSLVHKFREAKRHDSNVTIWGDGSAGRDFLYVTDLADLVCRFLENDFRGAVNVGSGYTASIREVALILADITGLDYYTRVEYDTTKPTGRPTCYSDLSELRRMNWLPSFSLQAGLRETYDWHAAGA